MRVVLQRVTEARVTVQPDLCRSIGPGLVLLLGIEPEDGPADIEWLTEKIVRLRLFDDESGAMNRSVSDAQGEILLISQFTLFASTRKGTRPSWHRAAKPEVAIPLYEAFQARLTAALGRPIATGVFGAHMAVQLVNDGPVTLIIDSKERE
ncbi:MAG TPA: D-aminoacyl-tRNA deacylase [Candidatus Limnocylindria bacterium]|nr:D-aminoacyl-tRNA deacylase [Candidatus Limnocylindria bacterium]